MLFLREYDEKALVVICLALFIVIANILVIGKPKNINSIYWYSLISLLSLLIVTTFTNQAALVPKAIMKTYKLGNIEASSVVLDKEGCNILNQYMKFYQVKNDRDDQLKQVKIENDLCVFPKMHILSKLGKETYVKVKVKTLDKKEKTIKFTLPSSSIVSYNPIN